MNLSIELTNEQSRQIAVKYIVQEWYKNKLFMDDKESHNYYFILKEFATNEEMKSINSFF